MAGEKSFYGKENSFLLFSTSYSEKINQAIGSFLDSEIKTMEGPELSAVCSMIKDYSLSGGKRLRPLSFLLSYEACSGEMKLKSQMVRALLPAIAIELHHTYSLILDDIMDEDESRRGKPGINAMLKRNYFSKQKEREYQGFLFNRASSRYAVSFGIMLGNLTNIFSKKAVISSDFSDSLKSRALERIQTADKRLYFGQMLDLIYEDAQVGEKEYIEMARLKTAVLFGMSFELGALFGGADEKTQLFFREFGEKAAIGFQLQDDILDIIGGKGHDIGSDIKKGKKTLLLIKTMEKADNSQKGLIKKVLGNPDAGREEIDKVISIMQSAGAIDYCRRLGERYAAEAEKILAKIALPEHSKKKIIEFNEFMMGRAY